MYGINILFLLHTWFRCNNKKFVHTSPKLEVSFAKIGLHNFEVCWEKVFDVTTDLCIHHSTTLEYTNFHIVHGKWGNRQQNVASLLFLLNLMDGEVREWIYYLEIETWCEFNVMGSKPKNEGSNSEYRNICQIK